MKSFRQYQEDSGGAGGAAVVGAASTGSVTGGISGAGDNEDKTVPVSKKKQKEYVSAVKEQTDPDEKEQTSKHGATPPSVRQRLIRHKIANERETEHSLRKRAAIVSNIPNIGAVSTPKSTPRRITGAVNMESFAEFHKKSKIKPGTGVGPLAFMTKEEADVNEGTVAHQKLTTAQNATTSKNPTGFVKVGDTGHLGFGTKGGAGFTGTVSKIEGDMVHMTSKYNKNKTYRGHVSKFTKD